MRSDIVRLHRKCGPIVAYGIISRIEVVPLSAFCRPYPTTAEIVAPSARPARPQCLFAAIPHGSSIAQPAGGKTLAVSVPPESLMARFPVFRSRNPEETRGFLESKQFRFDMPPRQAHEL